MNAIVRRILLFILFPALLMAVSCTEKPLEVIEYLEVNSNTISGNWQLDSWKGSALAEGTEMYIKFVRNDQTYRMWQTMDSFSGIPHYVTGEFNITMDVISGAVISGKYDNDEGLWQHSYMVKDLTATEMTWVAVDDPDFVQHFIRVESIPYEIEQ